VRFLEAPPPPFRVHQSGSTLLWVHPEVESWAVGVVRAGRTLHDWALEHAAPRAEGPLTGRGVVPVVAIPPSGTPHAVRHLQRGGWLAPLLGDRFLGSARIRLPRAFRELQVSEACRAMGIPTPPVRVAALYRAGGVHRGDLVTEYLTDSVPLPTLLRDQAEAAVEAMRRSGVLLRTLAQHGVHHPDLNIKNLIFQVGPEGWKDWVLDLDGARVHPRQGSAPTPSALSRSGRRMAARFRRSLRKWEATQSAPLPAAVWEAFERAVG
jgi:hypothetical protein